MSQALLLLGGLLVGCYTACIGANLWMLRVERRGRLPRASLLFGHLFAACAGRCWWNKPLVLLALLSLVLIDPANRSLFRRPGTGR